MPLVAVSIAFALLGVLLIGIAGPMQRREIEPNPNIGLRTRDTLAEPQVWYEANAASGRDLFRFGVTLIAAAALLPWLVGRIAIPVLFALVIGGMLSVAVRGAIRAAKLRSSRHPGDLR